MPSITSSKTTQYVRTSLEGTGKRVSLDSSSSSSSSLRNSTSPSPPAYTESAASSRTTVDAFDKLKARIQSKIEERNARISLYEAWQRKLPTYPTELSPSCAKPAAPSYTTTGALDKLKARIQSKIAERNSRASLFEAWQRKLPTYPAGPLGQTLSSSNVVRA
jgi:hypothetical protein